MSDAEEWRDIPGSDGKYRISNLGRIEGPTGLMSGFVTRDGYKRVNLRISNVHHQKVLHKLVAEAFIGDQPPGTEVHLLDGDKQNVAASNLSYVPRGSGAAKATGARQPRPKNSDGSRQSLYVRKGPGRPLRGEECGRARLTEADARDILIAYERHSRRGSVRKKTATLAEIAEIYGVAKTTIYALINGDNWRYLHLQLFGRSSPSSQWLTSKRKLSESDRAEWQLARARIMRQTFATVRNSGKSHIRTIKPKQLNVADLGNLLDEIVRRQGYRCAQTKVRFEESSPDLRASLDRIDNDLHYSVGNLQLVTSWYNFAKGPRQDSTMMKLLGIHAGLFESSYQWPAKAEP